MCWSYRTRPARAGAETVARPVANPIPSPQPSTTRSPRRAGHRVRFHQSRRSWPVPPRLRHPGMTRCREPEGPVAMMHCSLHYCSNSPHLSKLFTGFALLRRAGAVTLSQECLPPVVIDVGRPQHLRNARLAHLLVVVDSTVRLYYDNHDSDEIDMDAAEGVDFYFKRSVSRPHLPMGLEGKVFPLGLNYELYPDIVDTLELERDRAFTRCSRPPNARADRLKSSFRPTPMNMHAPPAEHAPPKVLFITRPGTRSTIRTGPPKRQWRGFA